MTYCSKCGYKLHPDNKYCPNCGHKVEVSEEAEATEEETDFPERLDFD